MILDSATLSSGEKKTLAIIVAVAVAFVAVVGTSVFLLTRDSRGEEHPGYLQLSVGDQLHRIEPVKWCDAFLEECEPSGEQLPTPHAPVPVGQSVVMSVSGDIAEFSWNMKAVYWTPKGIVEDESTKESGTTYSQVLRSRPDSVLIGLSVYPPSVIKDQNGDYYARGILTVDTSPEGFTATD